MAIAEEDEEGPDSDGGLGANVDNLLKALYTPPSQGSNDLFDHHDHGDDESAGGPPAKKKVKFVDEAAMKRSNFKRMTADDLEALLFSDTEDAE